jgi:hypothetical protein
MSSFFQLFASSALSIDQCVYRPFNSGCARTALSTLVYYKVDARGYDAIAFAVDSSLVCGVVGLTMGQKRIC